MQTVPLATDQVPDTIADAIAQRKGADRAGVIRVEAEAFSA